VYKIFERVMFDKDVGTGEKTTSSNGSYSSTGATSSWAIKNKLPGESPNQCYYWTIPQTCTSDEVNSLTNGTAIFDHYILKPVSGTVNSTQGDGNTSHPGPPQIPQSSGPTIAAPMLTIATLAICLMTVQHWT
jgi:hypothetical protein